MYQLLVISVLCFLYQINASAVVGVNPSVAAQVKEQGGLFKQSIMGDFLRVPTNKTQVCLLFAIPVTVTKQLHFSAWVTCIYLIVTHGSALLP